MSNKTHYPCEGGTCPFAIEPSAQMCKQCEDDEVLDRELEQMNAEIAAENKAIIEAGVERYYTQFPNERPKEDLPMTTNQVNQMNANTTVVNAIEMNKEVTTMNTMTKNELRTAIEALHPEFKISNTAFKAIKREHLVELLDVLPNVIRLMDVDKLTDTFNVYMDLAKRGTVLPMEEVTIIEVGASEASANGAGLDTAPVVEEASEASVQGTEATVLATGVSVLPRAGIKDGVLGLYLNKERVEGVADLSYAQKQIDEMAAIIKALELKVKELSKAGTVVEQPKVVTQASVPAPTEEVKSGRKPRHTAEEMEAARSQAMATGQSVKIESMPARQNTNDSADVGTKELNSTPYTCGCGGPVTLSNVKFLQNPKVQEKLPVQFKKIALCWHCQQAVLGGGRPFTAEERKANLHKQVRPVHLSLK